MPLIGFAGAPFTLASYLVEGGPSRNHERTKALMLGEPQTWDALMRALVAVIGPHVRAQVAAGARVAGLSTRGWALWTPTTTGPACCHTCAEFVSLIDLDVPVIHFGVARASCCRCCAKPVAT